MQRMKPANLYFEGVFIDMNDLKLAGLKTERSTIEVNGVTIGGQESYPYGGTLCRRIEPSDESVS